MDFDSDGGRDYRVSDVDNWLSNTYYGYLDTAIANSIPTVATVYLYASYNVTRKVFLFSEIELGLSMDSAFPEEGTLIPYFSSNTLRKMYISGSSTARIWWTRRRGLSGSDVYAVKDDGTGRSYYPGDSYYVLPAFNLSGTTMVSLTTDIDGCYTLM